MKLAAMLKIYCRTLIVTWRVFGPSRVLLSWLVAEPLFKLFTGLTLALDHLLFPGFRKVVVRRPVFIIGHPRSGTTFLHHLLAQGENVAAFHTWHILFPALTARLLLRRWVNYRVKIGKTEVMPEETGHQMALDKIEEEEMLFRHNYDTNFTTIGMLSLDEQTYPELQYHDQQPRADRMRSMRFLDGCFKRHIRYTGQGQIIAQTHFSTFRLKTMLEFYPDAKFIFVMRNPHQVVPSFLSLLHNSLKFRKGIEAITPELWQRYHSRRFQGMVDLYRYYYELDKNGELPRERVMTLPYELLRNDLSAAFAKIIAFTGLEVDDTQRQAVTERSKAQQGYQRRHQVKELTEFGLSHEQISREFAFAFAYYGMDDRWE